MRRPLAVWCAVFAACCTAARLMPSVTFSAVGLGLCAAAVSALAVGFYFRRTNKLKIALSLCVAAALACLSGTAQAAVTARRHSACLGDGAQVVFAVSDVGRYYGGTRLAQLTVIQLDGERFTLKADAYISEAVQTGDIYSCDSAEFEFSFDGSARLKLNGALIYRGSTYPVRRWFARLREGIASSLAAAVGGDEGALAAAMVTGERSWLNTQLQCALRRSGLSHIVVVSGLHISLMIYFVSRLFKILFGRFFTSRVPVCVLSAAAAVFLMFAAGFTPSVIRAGFAALLANTASLAGRRADGITSLALASALVALFDPAALLSASFWLSFSCTLGLLVILPAALRALVPQRDREGRRRRLLRRGLSALLLPVCATAATLPVLAAFGMPVSLMSPLTNLAAVWLLPVCMGLCFTVAALFPVAGLSAVCAVFARAARAVLSVLLWVANGASSVGFAAVESYGLQYKLWLAVCAVFAAVWLIFLRKRLRPVLAAAICAALLAVTAAADAFVFGGAVKLSLTGAHSTSVCFEDGSAVCAGSSSYDLRLLYEQSLGLRRGDFVLAVSPRRNALSELRGLFPDAEILTDDIAGQGAECRIIYTKDLGMLLYSYEGRFLGLYARFEGADVLFVFDESAVSLIGDKPDMYVWCGALPDSGGYGIIYEDTADGEMLFSRDDRAAVYIFPDGRIVTVSEWNITTRKN